MKLTLALFVVGSLVCLCLVDGHGSNPCAEGHENTQQCFDHIKAIGYDDERFFFGSDYKERCQFDFVSVNCYNPFYSWNNSISSIIFGNDDTALDGIDRFLHVQFHSEPFEYYGCGTHIQLPEVSFSLDISLKEHEPATARNLDKVTWDYEDGEMFTLIAVDPGFSALHMLAVNIPGDNMMSAQVIREYGGPLNYRFVPNPYVFLLFKQPTGRIEITDEWMASIYTRAFPTQIPAFMADYGLMGPIAMNILLATTDPYAVETLQSFAGELTQNCAAFVERALKENDEPFLPEVFSLTAFLNVTIRSDYDSFYYCCENNILSKQAVQLDPISNKILGAGATRTGSDVTIVVTPNVIPPTITDITLGMRFTVISVDPDVPVDTVGTPERPLIHYFAYNVQIEQLTSITGVLKGGRTIINWNGPMPPDDQFHSYYFLLLWQPQEFADDDAVGLHLYTGEDCNPRLQIRCLFDVRRFVSDKGLELSGASWFRSFKDDFVSYSRNTPEEEWCGDRLPCALPPMEAKAPGMSGISLGMTLIVASLCSWLF